MGCARDDSDFDFIAQYSPELVDFLLAEGFTAMSTNRYPPLTNAEGGAKTQGVYEKREESGHVIQVQAAYDALLRCNVRDVIKTFIADEHRKANQAERDKLWGAIADVLSFKATASHEDLPF